MIDHRQESRHLRPGDDNVILRITPDVGRALGRIEIMKRQAAIRINDFELIKCHCLVPILTRPYSPTAE